MSLNIRRYINSIFTSNTYLVWLDGNKDGLIVDCGDTELLFKDVINLDLRITAVLLTHAHFDHIYGLNKLLDKFPSVTIYTNKHGYDALLSAKLNMSRYHETPYVLENSKNVRVIEDSSLMISGMEFHVKETPGHNPSCLTFYTQECIFTGDSYIPGVKVVTNLPRGNKEQALKSLLKISELSCGKIIYPGHGDKEENRYCNMATIKDFSQMENVIK